MKIVEASKLKRDQTKEMARLTQKLWELGKASAVDLLTAQNDVLEAKIEFAKAKMDDANLRFQLAPQMGYGRTEL